MKNYILILDFGSQFTQLIARRIRELGVFSEIRACTLKPSEVDLSQIKGLILSGGPASVTDRDAPTFDSTWLSTGVPVLGVCYGMQLLSHLAGAKLGAGQSREYGHTVLEILDNSSIFHGFDSAEKTHVWMSHGDHVQNVPAGFKLLASSSGSPIAAIGNDAKRHYAVQFHPEVVHSARGREVLSNFLFRIAGCERNWSSSGFIEQSIRKISEQIGTNDQVICALSGGVDSTVGAVLASKALGARLHCIFVDNGLLRKNEASEVMARLSSLGLNVRLVDASQQFLGELSGVTDPEQKRKIIGRVFIEVFEAATKVIPNVTHLLQGTLYPDVIESAPVRGPSTTIKTHHNVGGLPERMKLKLLEPFRELFKDEVRSVGRDLGVPSEIINRHPFPGPGLAVRILGEITPERLTILREADRIFREEIVSEGVYDEIWQAFAVLLPVKSVGVMGDGRTYEQTIALRAVRSEDGMTADWYYFSQEFLRRTSNRISNEVRGVNRVVFDISSKPPATIEWE
jgi:GMP synthase (glutamine-hydrolysing)